MSALGLASLKKELIVKILEHSSEQKECSLGTTAWNFTSPGVRSLFLCLHPALSTPCLLPADHRASVPALHTCCALLPPPAPMATALLWCPLPVAALCLEFLADVLRSGSQHGPSAPASGPSASFHWQLRTQEWRAWHGGKGKRGPERGAASEPWCVQGMEKSGPGERPPPCPFPVPRGIGLG